MSSSPPTIKHLVISSGGPAGFTMYGALRYLNKEDVWNINNIKTMYCTSVGTCIATLLALNYDWDTIDNFLLKRPWSKIYLNNSSSSSGTGTSSNLSAAGTAAHTSAVGAVTASIAEATSKAASYAFNAKHKIDNIVKIYTQNGLYGMKEFNESLRPVLEGKDLSINTTLKEFYEKTGIDIHFFVTELNKFVSVDFSYKTHPNQLLVEACYMSSSVPLAFTPIIRDGCVYLDGAIINDYPLNECIRDQKCDIREIMGVKLYWERIPGNVTEKSSIIHLMSVFMSQIKANLFEHRFIQTIPNEVICVSKGQTLQDWVNSLKDENCRRELMQRGEVFAKLFLSYRRNYTSTKNSSSNTTEILVQTPALEENDAINKIIVNHDIVGVDDHQDDDHPVHDHQDDDHPDDDHPDDDHPDDDHQVDTDAVSSNDNNKEII